MLLPLPDSPTSATSCPGSRLRLMLSSATTSGRVGYLEGAVVISGEAGQMEDAGG